MASLLSNQAKMQQLCTLAQTDLFSVLEGSGADAQMIPKLCYNIMQIVEVILDPEVDIDLSDRSAQDFLRITLPTLCEALLRRNTRREHADDVAKMFIVLAKLLAKPASHDILELCELRNLLLIGILPPQFKFINPRQFTSNQQVGPHITHDGFYGEYGVPSVAYMGHKMYSFWPDEWQKALGGMKAVGHFVEWYHVGQTNSKAGTAAATTGTATDSDFKATGWLVGRVTGFKRETGEHIIQLEPIQPNKSISDGNYDDGSSSENAGGSSSDASPVPPSTPAAVLSTVHLGKVRHHWVDSEYRNRIPLHPVVSTSSAPGGAGEQLLEYANTDVGHFIRIWWSRYDKYFYGRVVRYDPVSRLHTVCYEDGDTRPYDMLTKEYSLVLPPPEAMNKATEADLSDVEASKVVANWHRGLETTTAETTPKTFPDGEFGPFKFTYVSRPVAATALNVSIFQLAAIEEYFREGGADSMFQSLTDASQAPPVSRIILAHLQLVYQLRNLIGAERCNELAWELKEAIPLALLRYEDAQIKELSSKTLSDILGGLKDTLLVAVNGTQYSTNVNIKETIDEMKLNISSMLLVCSQLQKRYLGLSMIKDTLEMLLPKLDAYMVKRYNAIGVPKTAKAAVGRVPGAAAHTRITTASMDKWLVDNAVIETLFGESLHQDLVAKSDMILVYMGSRKVLTEKHVDLIWNASLGVHEAVVRVLHQLLLLIVPVLGTALRSYLFGLMSALPCKEYTEQILQLIKSYTVQALIASKEDEAKAANNANQNPSNASQDSANGGTSAPSSKKGQILSAPQRQWMGFGVLWQFVQDPSAPGSSDSVAASGLGGKAHDGVDEGLIDLAVQLLVELLQEEFKDERELVMQRCLDNIQAGRSVPVSLQILRRTLALYPQSPKAWFVLGRPGATKPVTVGHQIEKLIKNSQLLEILFRDLEAHHRSIVASEKAAESSGGLINFIGLKKVRLGVLTEKSTSKMSKSQSASSQLLPSASGAANSKAGSSTASRVSQLKGVSERLDFLRFIISWSSVRLSEQQTMILWNAFGEGATTLETVEKLFLWFNVLINKESKPLTVLLGSLSQESDPTDPEQRSKLAFLSPQLGAMSQQQGFGFQSNSNTANAIAVLSAPTGSPEGDAAAGTVTTGAAPDGSHSTFDEGVLVKLFEDHIMKWAFQFEKVEILSRLPVANLCFKLFLHANITNRAIKVEADGSWSRVGQLVGLPLLWRIALDATDVQVADAALALLIELHHKSTGKAPKSGEGYKPGLLRLCFMHLFLSMQTLQLEEDGSHNGNSPPADPPAATAKSTTTNNSAALEMNNQDEWFHDSDVLMKPAVIAARIERLIVALRMAIHRFYMAPTVLHTIKVLVGRDETPAFTVVLKATNHIGHLRRKIAEHFKESVESIQILKSGKANVLGIGSPTQEAIEKDELTLVQAKLNVQDAVTARKRDSPTGEIGTPVGSIQPPKVIRQSDLTDLFSPQDLSVNLLKPLSPLQWMCSGNSVVDGSAKQSSASPSTKSENCADNSYELFVTPPFPLVSVIEGKLAMYCDTGLPLEDAGNAPAKSPVGKDTPASPASAVPAVGDRVNRVLEYLTPIIRASPHYIDQLLEVLDGYLSTDSAGESHARSAATGVELSAAVWDILLSLPTHVQLTQQLRGMVLVESNASQLGRLLSPSCPYRLLYSLQIIESFLCLANTTAAANNAASAAVSVNGKASSGSGAAVLEWTVKFFHVGGAEYILHLLESFLARESQRDTKFVYTSQSSKNGASEGMPRKDLSVMIISLLSRVLFHLLMLDPMFRCWQSLANSEATSRIYSAEAVQQADTVPPGVILSSIDVQVLCTQIMQCTLHASELLKANQITATALKAMCENAGMLMFGLLNSVGEGLVILSTDHICRRWMSALCVRCASRPVRQAACRRVFEACANIFNKCADPAVQQEDKRSRLRLFDYLYQEIVVVVNPDYSSSAVPEGVKRSSSGGHTERIRNGEDIYTLVAAIEALKNSPYLIFPEISSQKVMRSSSTKSPDAASPSSSVVSAPDSARSSPSSPRVNSSGGDATQAYALMQLFMLKLMKHTSSESFHSAEPDGTLVGILRVLLVFANSSDDKRLLLGSLHADLEHASSVRLISFLYLHCLFPTLISTVSPGDASPIVSAGTSEQPVASTEAACQTEVSRKLAYALLFRLCESTSENLAQLVEVIGGDIPAFNALVPLREDGFTSEYASANAMMKRLPVWNYDPGTLVKEPDAFVGLCNQGGTCYMNSFVQQLFHIPAFKQGLLRINAAGANKGNTKESKIESELMDDNARLLFQLQVMFGFMNFSQKRYYDTLPFCRAFIDYDGEPISMVEQKDINEFAGMLFDKLEHNKEAAALLASTIQGKIVWRTRSIETPYRSEREESFYMLTAEVKDKATLEDSLELFTAEELFSGDNKIEDSDTGRKVDALRGCAIRTLPSTLIIHLKRFEFDLETMNRKKVNDLISFPTDLNMYPYTEEGVQAKEDKLRTAGDSPTPVDGSAEEGLVDEAPATPLPATGPSKKPDSYYKYALKGIVAHVGAIDRGHYYSFIKDKDGSTSSGAGGWLEFNDRSVLPFSPDAIPSECFGGKEEYVNANGLATTRARENNAYLLIYERVSADEAEEPDHHRPRLSSGSVDDTLGGASLRNVRSGSIDETPRGRVSKKVMQAVSTENAEFQRDRFLFHPLHFAFIWQMQQMQSVIELLEQAKAKSSAEHHHGQHHLTPSTHTGESCLSLAVPVADHSFGSEASAALSNLVVVSMRFVVEVLVRARAQACVHLFVERLEEIVMQDTSGSCARVLMNTFASTAAPCTEGGSPKAAVGDSSSGANSSMVLSAIGNASNKSKLQTDLEMLDRTCHPWLTQMLVFCPHPTVTRGFLRFLLTCCKVLRTLPAVPVGMPDEYYTALAADPASPQNAAVALGVYPAVGALLDKIMMITEKPQLDYLGCKDGYELRTLFLLNYAGLGMEEKALLVHLGAIPRLSCSLQVMYPAFANRTSETKLHFCSDLISKLVKVGRIKGREVEISHSSRTYSSGEAGTSKSPDFSFATSNKASVKGYSGNGGSGHGHGHGHSGAHVNVFLKPIDLQAFLSRTYLEQALIVHAGSTASALQHVYKLVDVEEGVKLVDFFAEKILEYLSTPAGINLCYRSYFKALSDLLLGSALKDVLLHQASITKITVKAQGLSNRLAVNDSDFLLASTKLLHTLGCASTDAHNVVMRLRDHWKGIAAKLAAAKRTAGSTGTGGNADGSAAQGTGAAGGGGGHGAPAAQNSVKQNVFGKATSAASAFMMN